MPRTRDEAITVRLERARQLADDLARELVRARAGGMPANRAIADRIKAEIETAIRDLNESRHRASPKND